MKRLAATGLDESVAWAKLYAEIVLMSPQLPTSHKGDEHRVCYMRRAVCSRPWSRFALQHVASQGMHFKQFSRKLQSALQLYKEGWMHYEDGETGTSCKESESVFGFVGQKRFERRKLAAFIGNSHPYPRRKPGCSWLFQLR